MNNEEKFLVLLKDKPTQKEAVERLGMSVRGFNKMLHRMRKRYTIVSVGKAGVWRYERLDKQNQRV